jgi:hypothetical protein
MNERMVGDLIEDALSSRAAKEMVSLCGKRRVCYFGY